MCFCLVCVVWDTWLSHAQLYKELHQHRLKEIEGCPLESLQIKLALSPRSLGLWPGIVLLYQRWLHDRDIWFLNKPTKEGPWFRDMELA